MKLITYNVNGIRSALSKDWLTWLEAANPDIVCLQEIKASPDQIITALPLLEKLGYEHYWYPAQKKGYSGTAILSKISPTHVEYGCGDCDYDFEGRVLRADFEGFSVLSTYFPSGSSGDLRQAFKYRFLKDFQVYIDQLKLSRPNLIISGDYNICHKPIDIHNPKSNANSSGFLPEEREWMENFINAGFVDTFREFNPDPHHYTWWSFRAGARAKNLGWRIDYNLASEGLRSALKRSSILSQAIHSDHCPVLVEFDI
ncbi:Exodeoxyribonuclease III [Arcticibacter svalbardensis MN12-7]|uniref:Exodeoxyribonuclease III n=1 Tax=Arcticibacter svalbardensis MN12-7 TaxID=1150600 RepID=R9GRV7_9SPHI|nr:exodeoxyribonuclease III [Arcticibacter svalbardensis]EOR94433.1 Exodeoxyribonuclease III [Arcticibacter svalbardensis MN12-7]